MQMPGDHSETDGSQAALLEQRQEQLRQATSPLPGSVPYDNFRPINVPGRFAGSTLIDFLAARFPNTSRERWLELIAAGRIVPHRSVAATSGRHSVWEPGTNRVSPDQVVREGDRFDRLTPQYVEPDVNADIQILYEDDSIVLVNKPAPLPMHACGRFERSTLQAILDSVYAPQRLRAAHRLDAATSGIVLHSRSRAVARVVQPQFEQRRVEKVYVAKVIGHPAEDDFKCTEPIAAATQPGGLRNTDRDGLPAETRFRVLRRTADGTSLIEARPITGRTNQIRIHLWSLGLPICGDSYYLPDYRLGSNDVPDTEAVQLCLHAKSLTFEHPETDEPFTFEAPLPGWALMGSGSDS
jgi:UPF0176 protein